MRERSIASKPTDALLLTISIAALEETFARAKET